jgi:hypothetical protein
MNKCPQNSAKTTENTVEDQILGHILETVNHAIAMFNTRSTTHFFVYCEEQITTLLPVARILTQGDGKHLADKLDTTLHLMQIGDPISEIDLRAA